MIKNILALIGLYVVCKVAYEKYDQHVRKPVERLIVESIDEEHKRVQPPAAAAPAAEPARAS